MTGTGSVSAKRCQYLGDFSANLLTLCKQYVRIQIALQRNALTDLGTGSAHVDGPVESDCAGTDVGDFIQPQAATFGEDDAWNLDAVFFRLQVLHHFAHVMQ